LEPRSALASRAEPGRRRASAGEALLVTSDGVYWLFASSAQTVAAFVAFLLAGFTLVLGMLDSAASRDETLIEINQSLKRKHYGRLRELSELTAAAIVTDLTIVLVHGSRVAYLPWPLLGIGFVLDVAAIVLAVWFIF
jgi:hypothetical protein